MNECIICHKKIRKIQDFKVGMERKLHLLCGAKLKRIFNASDEMLAEFRFSVRDIHLDAIAKRWGYDGRNFTANTLTLEETGKILGVTRERVRQIEAKVLENARIMFNKTWKENPQ